MQSWSTINKFNQRERNLKTYMYDDIMSCVYIYIYKCVSINGTRYYCMQLFPNNGTQKISFKNLGQK